MARDYTTGEWIRPSHINKITPDDGEIIVGGPDDPVRRPVSDFENAVVLADVDTLETSVAGMPTVIAGNYTKRLANYSSLAAAIADLPNAGADGGDILLDGEVPVTATTAITAPINLLGRGRDASAFVAPASVTFPVLDIDGRSGVTLADFAVIKAAGANASGSGYGVHVRGNATRILIDRVLSDGFVAPFYVAGQLGSVPGTVGTVTLRDCIAANSPTNFGYWIDDCDVLYVDNLEAYGNWLDGFKLRKATKRVRMNAGYFHHNGVSGNGDGADMYAGGEEFVITAAVFSQNTGSGLVIKQGVGTDPATYGYVNNVDLVAIQCTDNTNGAGLYMSEAQGDTAPPAVPLTSNISVNGGLFARNKTATAGDGIYVGTRNTVIGGGARIIHNDRNGILINDRALEVTVGEVIVAGNSRAAAGSYDGISTSGAHVRIVSGTILGIENPDISDEAEYATQTKWHRYNINMAGGDDVWVGMGVREGYAAQPLGIFAQPAAATKRFISEQPLTGSVMGHGSVGSTRIKSDETGRQVVWHKVSGATNAPTTGWAPALHGNGPRAQSLDFGSIAPGASATLTITFSAADGVTASDMAIVTPPSTLDPALVVHAWCGTNVVTIRLFNPTAVAIDPVAGTWLAATVRV